MTRRDREVGRLLTELENLIALINTRVEKTVCVKHETVAVRSRPLTQTTAHY